MNIPKTIGERVRYMREQAGLNMAQLAQVCDMSASTVRHIELGLNGPTTPTAEKLMKAFNVSRNWLLLGRPEIETDPRFEESRKVETHEPIAKKQGSEAYYNTMARMREIPEQAVDGVILDLMTLKISKAFKHGSDPLALAYARTLEQAAALWLMLEEGF